LDLPAIQFRCSLVPTDDLAIDNFPDRFLDPPRAFPRTEIDNETTVVALPTWTSEWRRRYRAVEHVKPDPKLYSLASFEADGVFNQVTIVVGLGGEPFRTTEAALLDLTRRDFITLLSSAAASPFRGRREFMALLEV
jgi:hypothetical protein